MMATKQMLLSVLILGATTGLAMEEKQNKSYSTLKELGLDDQLWCACSDNENAWLWRSSNEIKKECVFLEKTFATIKQRGCSQESLGLGFKGACKHFHEQDEETQVLIAEIRNAYLESPRNEGNKRLKEAIKKILIGISNDDLNKELAKMHTLGNKFAVEYGEYLKKEKPEQIKRNKEQEKIERNKF
jgi:hypothetical protein